MLTAQGESWLGGADAQDWKRAESAGVDQNASQSLILLISKIT